MEKQSRDYYREPGGRRTKAHIVFGIYCLLLLIIGLFSFYASTRH